MEATGTTNSRSLPPPFSSAPLSTFSLGAVVAVSRNRPQGDHSAVTALASRVSAIGFTLPSALRSRKLTSPGRLPNPPSMRKRPKGFHRAVLKGPGDISCRGASVKALYSVHRAGMNP